MMKHKSNKRNMSVKDSHYCICHEKLTKAYVLIFGEKYVGALRV